MKYLERIVFNFSYNNRVELLWDKAIQGFLSLKINRARSFSKSAYEVAHVVLQLNASVLVLSQRCGTYCLYWTIALNFPFALGSDCSSRGVTR